VQAGIREGARARGNLTGPSVGLSPKHRVALRGCGRSHQLRGPGSVRQTCLIDQSLVMRTS
jgi:hypothetical protein